jgi:hypothetical protein
MVSTGDLAEVDSQLQTKESLGYLDAVSHVKLSRDSTADLRRGMSETNIDANAEIHIDSTLQTAGKPQRGPSGKKQKRSEMEAEEDMEMTAGGSEDSLNKTIIPNVAVDLPAVYKVHILSDLTAAATSASAATSSGVSNKPYYSVDKRRFPKETREPFKSAMENASKIGVLLSTQNIIDASSVSGKIPIDFKLQLQPSFGLNSPQYQERWAIRLAQCSLRLMAITKKELVSDLVRLQQEVDRAMSEMRPHLGSEWMHCVTREVTEFQEWVQTDEVEKHKVRNGDIKPNVVPAEDPQGDRKSVV